MSFTSHTQLGTHNKDCPRNEAVGPWHGLPMAERILISLHQQRLISITNRTRSERVSDAPCPCRGRKQAVDVRAYCTASAALAVDARSPQPVEGSRNAGLTRAGYLELPSLLPASAACPMSSSSATTDPWRAVQGGVAPVARRAAVYGSPMRSR